MARKENEISSRVNLPTHELKKPDHLISPGYLQKIKETREKLVANMLDKDAFGN